MRRNLLLSLAEAEFLPARWSAPVLAETERAIALEPGRAVAAIRHMRERFRKPVKTADVLLIDMELAGLVVAVDVLRDHVKSL